jgi:hypothetical protein
MIVKRHVHRNKRSRKLELTFPKWALVVFFIAAATLTPWTYSLAWFLPTKHLAIHWDAAWVGLDCIMIAMFVLTMIFAYRRSVWSLLTSVVLATLLFVDAWFDVLTATPGGELRQSSVAASIEVGLGLLILYLVYILVKELRAEIK